MNFSNLIGNGQAKEILLKLVKQPRDSHILLFSGPDGVGKTTFAKAFISLLLGEKHEGKIDANIHPDVIWLEPEGKLRLHTASCIKQMIDEAPLSPFEAKKKIYVVQKADRMLPPSSNALLKILEEPPSHLSFILITSEEGGILKTVLSRCNRIPFYPIEESLLVPFLREKGASLETSCLLAKHSKGSLSQALKLLEKGKDPVKSHFIKILRHFFMQRASLSFIEALDHLDTLIEKKGEEEEKGSQIGEELLDELFLWVRDLNYIKEDREGNDLFYPNYLEDLERQAKQKIPSLESTLLLIDKARLSFQRSMKCKVVYEKLFLEILDCIW